MLEDRHQILIDSVIEFGDIDTLEKIQKENYTVFMGVTFQVQDHAMIKEVKAILLGDILLY